MSRMKSAEDWVNEGVPLPTGKGHVDHPQYVRWVAMIQEDATSCYTVNEVIEDVCKAYEDFLQEWHNDDTTLAFEACKATLDAKIAKLESFKVKV